MVQGSQVTGNLCLHGKNRFEDEAWQLARKLTRRIYDNPEPLTLNL
jgi:hypothetical protein